MGGHLSNLPLRVGCSSQLLQSTQSNGLPQSWRQLSGAAASVHASFSHFPSDLSNKEELGATTRYLAFPSALPEQTDKGTRSDNPKALQSWAPRLVQCAAPKAGTGATSSTQGASGQGCNEPEMS